MTVLPALNGLISAPEKAEVRTQAFDVVTACGGLRSEPLGNKCFTRKRADVRAIALILWPLVHMS